MRFVDTAKVFLDYYFFNYCYFKDRLLNIYMYTKSLYHFTFSDEGWHERFISNISVFFPSNKTLKKYFCSYIIFFFCQHHVFIGTENIKKLARYGHKMYYASNSFSLCLCH